MKLGIRIFLLYMSIFAVCFYYPIDWVADHLRNRYLEGVEDPLVDQANILAAMAGGMMEEGEFDADRWYAMFQKAYSRNLNANIYQLLKSKVDLRVYLTDRSGKLVFDSESKASAGEDYSRWRDVHRTLNGKYGARTTLADKNDPTSSVLFVAAPVTVNGQLAGVLTVAKPTTNISYFLDQAKPEIGRVGGAAALAAIALSFLVSVWITRPIKRLTSYAHDIRDGKRAQLPPLDRTEIGEMGTAFEKMKEALEGKQYVEKYIQAFTHEIKSPLSAIRGAAELMAEPMPVERHDRFLANIRSEADRIQKVVDRMLALSALENRKKLERLETLSLRSMVRTVMESKAPFVSKKRLDITMEIPEEIMISGDGFLLHQALGNLVQNAVEFTPDGGMIGVTAKRDDESVVISVKNTGAAIPAFALNRVFEKFFSLQRPDTGKKSTGLGLNFVMEVAQLHGGGVALENAAGGGVCATITLPG